MSSLYILDINSLSVITLANIFSHSVGCLFILSMASSAGQKFLSLIRSHLFIFPFVSLAVGDRFKKDTAMIYVKECSMFSSRSFFFFLNFGFIYLFVFNYLWLCWVFVSVRGLSLVAASGGHSSSRCTGLSSSRPLLLRSTGSRRAGSAIVAHGPSCSVARGIFPDQGSNLCPLHWQADSQPLRHQGSPSSRSFMVSALTFYFMFNPF